MLYETLLIAHVAFTTGGYAGLIATNAALPFLCRRQDAGAVLTAVSVWRKSARLFGLLAGFGMLVGFGLASVEHVAFASIWLLVTYALVVLVIIMQAAILVPWQSRAEKAIARGEQLSVLPVMLTLSYYSVAYVTIVALMFAKPT